MKNLRSILKSMALAGALAWPGLVGAATTNWVAYFDYGSRVAGMSNVLNWNTANNNVGGYFTNQATGAQLPVFLWVTSSNAPGNANTVEALVAGTPAYAIFNGICDLSGNCLAYISADNMSCTLTFSNLNPTMKYVIIGTVNRNSSGYTVRQNKIELRGADSLTPAHTANVITAGLPPNTAVLMAYNQTGDYVCWTDISPGADGTIDILNSRNIAGNTCYALSAIELIEVTTVACTTHISNVQATPAETNLLELHPFTLSVSGEGCIDSHQWYKDGNAISGATSPTFTRASAKYPDDSGQYYCVLSGPVDPSGVVSPVINVTINQDTTPLLATRAVAAADNMSVTLTFNKAVDPASVDPSNFGLDPSDTGIVSATATTPTNVVLTFLAGFPLSPTTDYAIYFPGDAIFDTTSGPNYIQAGLRVPVERQVTVMAYEGQVWSYRSDGVDLGTAWRELGYDDSTWLTGPSILDSKHNGTPPDGRTALPNGMAVGTQVLPYPTGTTDYSTRYFRTHFNLPAKLENLALTLGTIIDDGVVVYINGQEAFRQNMAAGAVSYATFANVTVGDAAVAGPFVLPTTNVISGDNLVAVEVHQAAITSSDITLALDITATIANAASGPVVFTRQPVGGTIDEFQSFSFSAVAEGGLPLNYQWYLGANPIPGATNFVYHIASANRTQAGVYKVQVNGVDSSTATLNVIADTTPPVVLSANGGAAANTTILVAFSKTVALASAENTAHYSLTPSGLTVTSAVVTNGTNVLLTLSGPRTASTTYTLRVQDVTDTASVPNMMAPNPTELKVLTLVDLITVSGHSWKYLDEKVLDAPPCLDGTTWTSPAYDDGTWSTGFGIFFGKNTNSFAQPAPNPAALPLVLDTNAPAFNTVLTIVNLFTNGGGTNQEITWYFRTTFNFPGETNGARLLAHTMLDDGAVFYLNGQRLYDVRQTNNPVFCTNLTTATSAGQTWEPLMTAAPMVIPMAGLKTGQNTLAVELHQETITSSDVTFGMLLQADILTFSAAAPTLNHSYVAGTGTLTLSWGDPTYVLVESTSLETPKSAWTVVSPQNSSGTSVSTASGTKFYTLRAP